MWLRQVVEETEEGWMMVEKYERVKVIMARRWEIINADKGKTKKRKRYET
jgi:hypothetical protein